MLGISKQIFTIYRRQARKQYFKRLCVRFFTLGGKLTIKKITNHHRWRS